MWSARLGLGGAFKASTHEYQWVSDRDSVAVAALIIRHHVVPAKSGHLACYASRVGYRLGDSERGNRREGTDAYTWEQKRKDEDFRS